MSFLGWSHLLLWLVVVMQGCAIVALFHYQGRAIIGKQVREDNFGPPIGAPLPGVTSQSLADETIDLAGRAPRSRVVIFVSAACATCGHMMNALRELVPRKELDEEILFVCGAGREAAAEMAKKWDLSPGSVLFDEDREIGRNWNVHATPFVVAFDEIGGVADRGRAGSKERLVAMLNAGGIRTDDVFASVNSGVVTTARGG